MRFRSMIGMMLGGALSMPALGASAQTVSNGGFENPALDSGGFIIYGPGQTIGAFTVFGPSGSDVATISTTYQDSSGTSNAHSGNAFLDLSGDITNGQMQGVFQSVSTIAGQSYALNFFIGHQRFDANPTIIGVSTTGPSGTFTTFQNGDTSGTDAASIVYMSFSLNFTATSSLTSIAFRNDQLGSIRSAPLDDITISPLAVAVPGPLAGAGLVPLLGLAGLAFARRRRSAATAA